MNKEVIVAIIIGIALGIGGAVYFSNVKPNPSIAKRQNLGADIAISPRVSGNNSQLTSFGGLPKQGEILTKKTITIQGNADQKSHIIAASRMAIEPVGVKNGEYKEEFDLKPGVNELVLYELNGEKDQLKLLKFYYLKIQNGGKTAGDKEASDEANLLKEKLEEKVIELRNNPTKVVNGTIKSIKDKNLVLTDGAETHNLTVEPEITNFLDVDGYELADTTFDDLGTGDEITAFISDIGGDEISYTVYREPATTIAAGKVSNIDSDNYKVTIIDFDKSSFGADVEVGTTQSVYETKARTVAKGGFSKLAIGSRIFARLSGSKDSYSIDEYLILE